MYGVFVLLCIVSAVFIGFGNEDLFVIGISFYGIVLLFSLVHFSTTQENKQIEEIRNTYRK